MPADPLPRTDTMDDLRERVQMAVRLHDADVDLSHAPFAASALDFARRLEAVMALLEEWESGFATMHEAGAAAALRRALTGETP